MITTQDHITAVADGILTDANTGYCNCHSNNALCAEHYVRYRADSDALHDIAYSAYRAAAQAYGAPSDYNTHIAAEAFAAKIVRATA